MKIAYITQYYPPHTGGLEYVAQKTAESAVKAGHEAEVVTYALTRADRGVHMQNNVTVRRVPGLHFFDRYFSVPFCLGGLTMIRTILRAVRDADLVHVHDVFYPTSLVAYLASRWYKTPLVLSQHVGLVEHSNKLVMLIELLIYTLWGNRMFHASEKIIIYQSVVRDFLLNHSVPAHKILETRNGVDVHAFKSISPEEKAARRAHLGLPTDKPLALFVGRLVPKKGYRELFEARDPAYELVFVGPGTVPDAWKSTEGVHFLGERSPLELVHIYPMADMFVAPSRGEVFTIVMQEAFASGLPVVTTDDPTYDTHNLDRDLVALCEPTPEELKAQLRRIAGNKNLQERMGTYVRTLATDMFNWEHNVSDVLELYEELALTHPRVSVTTSWDDGHVLDTKLAALLRKYGIQGTFYIAPNDIEFPEDQRLTPDDIRALSQDFEIGAHTLRHQHLPTLDDAQAQREIVDSKHVLEQIVGKPVTSFCYPAGKYRSRHAKMVADAGYKLARTVHRFSTSTPTKPFELRTTVHTYDHWLDIWKLLLFVRWNPIAFFKLYRRWDAQAIALFDKVVEKGGIFHVWGHSWELEQRDGWQRLERVLQHISATSNVAHVPNKMLV